VLGFIVIVVIGLLIVNYFRQEDLGVTLPEGTMVENTLEAGNTHSVASGDTLWAISEQYYGTGFEWQTILEANGLVNASNIEEGQVLVIPEIIAEIPEDTSTPNIDTYTVIRGDSLWDIAVSAYGDGYRWTDIAKANNLVNPNVIHVGNVLVLPN